MALDKNGDAVTVGDTVRWSIRVNGGFSEGQARVTRISGDTLYLDQSDLDFSKEVPVQSQIVSIVLSDVEG